MKHFLLVIFTSLVTLSSMAADLAIHPNRFMFTESSGSQQLFLTNTSKKYLNYVVRVVDFEMDENGKFVEHDDSFRADNGLRDRVRLSTQAVSLSPGEQIAVSMSVRGRGLEDGEYAGMVEITAMSSANSTMETDLGFSFGVNLRRSIKFPIIYRQGVLKADVKIFNARYDGTFFSFDFGRKGERSVYGDILITNEDDVLVSQVKQTAVFLPLNKRSYNLKAAGIPSGEYTLSYKEDSKFGSGLKTEVTIEVN